MSGVLIGVGVGPGAPDLITLRGARRIEHARRIAYPRLPGLESFARQIAAAHIHPDAQNIEIEIPMTRARAPAQDAYDEGAKKIASALRDGHDVVVLCEGDPMLYGSFMYLLARLEGRFPVEIVPGVSSVAACAASAVVPLVARSEKLKILPATLDDETLRAELRGDDTFVFVKLGRHLSRLRTLLKSLKISDGAVYVERASLPDEKVLPLHEAPQDAPYFSMILLRRGVDPWL